MAANTDSNGVAHKLAKKPVQLHPETVALMQEVKGKTGFTNDQAIRAGLLKLNRDLGDVRAESPEEKIMRLAFGPQADG